MDNWAIKRRLLKPIKLSSFPEVQEAADIINSREDVIFMDRSEDLPIDRQWMNDIPSSPYILGLSDALVCPPAFFRGKTILPANTHQGRGGPFRREDSGLIILRDGCITTDSLHRSRVLTTAVDESEDGSMLVVAPDRVELLDEPCIFIGLVCRHFGHSIVDSPARLWPIARSFGSLIKQLKPVAYGMHGLSNNRNTWPSWLPELIDAYGINHSLIQILEKPTLCKRLVIPKRISPYGGVGGHPYNKLMQYAGDKLSRYALDSIDLPKRVFLSRSRVSSPSRKLNTASSIAIESLFESCGFSIIHPQELTLPQQVVLVRAASHIAGLAGSQMHLCSFSKMPGLRVARIRPSFYPGMTDLNIIRHIPGIFLDHSVVRKGHPERSRSLSWEISEEELARLQQALSSWI